MYLWARARLANLFDFERGETHEHVEEITALGLSYNLLTAYTSFVAVHEVVKNEGGSGHDVDQPSPLPLGVTDSALPTLQTGAEPELVWLALLLSAIFLLAARREFARRTAATESA